MLRVLLRLKCKNNIQGFPLKRFTPFYIFLWLVRHIEDFSDYLTQFYRSERLDRYLLLSCFSSCLPTALTILTFWKWDVTGYNPHVIDVFASLLQLVSAVTKRSKQALGFGSACWILGRTIISTAHTNWMLRSASTPRYRF